MASQIAKFFVPLIGISTPYQSNFSKSFIEFMPQCLSRIKALLIGNLNLKNLPEKNYYAENK